jgi:VWFA-related protein
MKRMSILFLSVLFLTAVDVPPSVTVSPTFLETLEVHVTSLDVIVTDRAGHPVAGLGRENFEIRDDGRPQEVSNFTEYDGSSSGTRLPAQADTLETPPERHFVFFIDEMSLHPLTRKKLLTDTLTFVNANMRPGDQAMIVTPAAPEKLALAFSGERDAVAAKLTSYINSQTFRADTRTESEQFFLRSVASAVGTREATRPYADRVNRRVTSTLRTLLGFIGGMAQTPGRKVVVLMTASLTAHPGEEAFGIGGGADYRPISMSFGARETVDEAVDRVGKRYTFDVTPMIRELGAIASANGITIYTVQPNLGFRISPPGAGSDNQSTGVGVISQSQRSLLEGTGETLGQLAKATGGKYYLGEDKIDEAFGQLASDVKSYYSIGYRTPPSGDGNIRKISVAVKGRNDLTVRTRRELMDRSPSREMDEQTAAALFAPPPVNELAMQAKATSPKREGRSGAFYGVEVAVTFPLERLTFVPADNGMYRATFAVHYAAADAADYTTGVVREQTLQVAAADLDSTLKKSYTYTTRLVVSPGTARVAVGVMDKASRLSSFERLVVEAR